MKGIFETRFSERNGMSSLPTQLKLGEIDPYFRNLLKHYVSLELDKHIFSNLYDSVYFDDGWRRVTQDIFVVLFRRPPEDYPKQPQWWRDFIKDYLSKESIGKVFDLIEFFVRHPECSDEMKSELAQAFVAARSAYRVISGDIIAVGSRQEAEAFTQAIEDADGKGASAARQHLVAAGSALKGGDWAGCVRESIHAVESVAIVLAPGATTLGPALAAIEKRGHIHVSLRSAFNKLYGYSSNEAGVRHALVFHDKANVDEADALFMMGACASFVSYLLSRSS